jgi:hypothetical protein
MNILLVNSEHDFHIMLIKDVEALTGFKYCQILFWYLNRCLVMNKFHVIEGDPDSAYWAIAGNPKEDYHQRFKYVIKDEWNVGLWIRIGQNCLQKDGEKLTLSQRSNRFILRPILLDKVPQWSGLNGSFCWISFLLLCL